MANLRTAMDAAFWDLNISTPQTLHGSARAVPGDPIPMDAARASRVLRIQQLSILSNGFPLGIIPAYAPPPSPNNKSLGPFCLQSLLVKPLSDNWWIGLVAQFRPKKLISAIKQEIFKDNSEVPSLKDAAKHFLDKSLYSIALSSQLSLTPSTSLLLSTERQGERTGHNKKAMLFHRLPNHDVTLEAAWPELFVDHHGSYWNVPESISLDCASLVSDSGFRYRVGIHKNSGLPQSDNSVREAPLALMPGLSAKAAFSYEKSKDLWRQKETEEDIIVETETGRYWQPPYDVRLKEPHAAVSGIIGGTCGAWFSGGKSLVAVEPQEDGNNASMAAKRGPCFKANLFGSVCYTFQHGKFRKLYRDLSRVDARLDISSASALAKRATNIFRKDKVNDAETLLSSPRLNLIFQQQVAGPIVFKVDSRFSLDSSSSGKHGPHLEDIVYSLNYSLRLLQSGKVVAWFSPIRKEGMIELRMFEF